MSDFEFLRKEEIHLFRKLCNKAEDFVQRSESHGASCLEQNYVNKKKKHL